ncbi:UDP-glucuronosyltransferase 2B33-like [Contarinia nasturtii]|uniref:UDP-glucuronosyltransferase 2B33-like n=1 Tax=Contarinia nasturtii TaxID=265458 RepID=UPI0012D3E20F|nr:UDP-glucuronosyltransferase 2B33-like [Contarinia nasturtii]
MFSLQVHWKILPFLLIQLATFNVGINGANILACLSSASKSHHIMETTILEELANRGHNVTVLSTFTRKKILPETYHHIYIQISDEEEWSTMRRNALNNVTKNDLNVFKGLPKILQITFQRSNLLMKHEAIQNLIKSDQHFDLFILDYNINDMMLGLAGHFRIPSVILSTSPPMKMLRDMIGNPAAISSAPIFRHDGKTKKMGFRERLDLFIAYTIEYFIMTYINYIYFEPFYAEHFAKLDNFPTLNDVRKNVSLILTSTHFSEGLIRPMLPNLIEISGVHIKEKTDPLPKNIEEILSTADANGVIVFCFGGNTRSADMSNDKVQMFYTVFSKLKQKVIWKWESNIYPPQKPDNIYMMPWIPQADLLAQQQVKLFISHCGIGGLYEALFNGIPILGMPIMSDQFQNAERIKNQGWAIILDFDHLNETILNDGIQEILNNSTYKMKAQRVSQLFRDRPMTPLQTAVYWIEYVIRYDGAKHMQSSAVHLNIIQSNSIDVILFLAIILYIFFKISMKIVPRILKYRSLFILLPSIVVYMLLPLEMLWTENKK